MWNIIRISYLKILNLFTNLFILRGNNFPRQFQISYIRNSRYFCLMLVTLASARMFEYVMNKDMGSLRPFYTVSCIVQRRANECFENKRERDCRVFFFQIKCLFANVPLCIIGICSWRHDVRSYLRGKKNVN